jgi:hypothetical protein
LAVRELGYPGTKVGALTTYGNHFDKPFSKAWREVDYREACAQGLVENGVKAIKQLRLLWFPRDRVTFLEYSEYHEI